MLQENFLKENARAFTKVIRIDAEVWCELQGRAVPLEDNPNSALRRILGLTSKAVVKANALGGISLEPRVIKLLELVEAHVGEPLGVSATKTGRSLRIRSKRGKLVAFIHQQIHRLKVESREQMATEAGVDSWDHSLINGWWAQDSSVYWYTPNDDDNAYDRAAGVLEKLWRL